MTQVVSQSGNYKNFTGTTTITAPGAKILGVFVSSSTAGTIKIQDGSTTVINTVSVSAATYYAIPAEVTTSIVITVGGTLDACIFWTA